jgi:hypothetical protein
MSSPDPKTDMIRSIEALLSTPAAGQAVARALSCKAGQRRDRAAVAEMQARRAEQLRSAERAARDRERLADAVGDGARPWSRTG